MTDSCSFGFRFQGHTTQHTKKLVSDSTGLVDFAIGLVNSVLVKYFEEFNVH